MLVNYARESGGLLRDQLKKSDLDNQRQQLLNDGLDLNPGFVLALRSSRLLTALIDTREAKEVDWPEPSESERIRLARKGQTLFEHCLAERSHICVTGFMEYELGRCKTGAKFLLGFLGWMLLERDAYSDPEEIEIIDHMIDFGLTLLYQTETRDGDMECSST